MDIVTTTLNATDDGDAVCEQKIRVTMLLSIMFTVLGIVALTLICVVFSVVRDNFLQSKYQPWVSKDDAIHYSAKYASASDYVHRFCQIAGWNELHSPGGCRVGMFVHLVLFADEEISSLKNIAPSNQKVLTAFRQLSECNTITQLKEWMAVFLVNPNVMYYMTPLVGKAYWWASNAKPDLKQVCKKERAFKQPVETAV